MIHLQTVEIIAFFLALMRATAFLLTCPPFAGATIPFVAQTALAGGLAFAEVGSLSHATVPLSTAGLIGAVVLQVAIGAAMGLVVQCFFGAIQAAGGIIDQFSGLNLPPSIDPLGLDQVPLIGQLYEWMATVLLFGTGAVVILVRGFLRSFSVVGITLPKNVLAQLPTFFGADLANLFVAAVEVAAPLVAVLFVAQLILALLAKTAPQTNVFSLGFPLQYFLTFATLGIGVVALPSDVANLVGRGVSQLVGG